MKRFQLDFTFIQGHPDAWGNAYVICPVCGDAKKENDGIMKHLTLIKDLEHTNFLKTYENKH